MNIHTYDRLMVGGDHWQCCALKAYWTPVPIIRPVGYVQNYRTLSTRRSITYKACIIDSSNDFKSLWKFSS